MDRAEGPLGVDWPLLGVALLTYDRFETAERSLRALLDRARYSGPLWVHVADDGSPDPDYAERLRVLAGGFPSVVKATASNAGQHGYGASYNLATQVLHTECDYIVPMEDDWELQPPGIDFDPLVQTLREIPEIACIRLGYIGYTQVLRGRFVPTPAGQMLLLDPDSPEPHVFAGHVRIETREFERTVGPWPEMIPAGQTEWDVGHRPEARTGIAWPLDVIRPSEHRFAHIGTRELGEHQPAGMTGTRSKR